MVACEELRRPFSTIIIKPDGIDYVGIAKFCWHDSDNNNHVVEDNPQFLTKMLKPLKRAHHRRLSRRQIGSSNNRKKESKAYTCLPYCMNVSITAGEKTFYTSCQRTIAANS